MLWRSSEYAMAQRTACSLNGFFFKFIKSHRKAVPSTRTSRVEPVDRLFTWAVGTASITSAAPACSCSTRALSSPISLKMILSRYGLPDCQ